MPEPRGAKEDEERWGEKNTETLTKQKEKPQLS